MIKQLGFVATALAAGLAAFGGSASATTVTVSGHPVGQNDHAPGVSGTRIRTSRIRSLAVARCFSPGGCRVNGCANRSGVEKGRHPEPPFVEP